MSFNKIFSQLLHISSTIFDRRNPTKVKLVLASRWEDKEQLSLQERPRRRDANAATFKLRDTRFVFGHVRDDATRTDTREQQALADASQFGRL